VSAELKWTSRPDAPTAVVLVLHGGQDKSQRPAKWHNLAVLRMVPVARAIAKGGGGSFAVAMLRYAVRGWNGAEASPVPDARAALDDISDAYPGLPIALVGHSMGGRVALALADDPRVVEVVGLAPWVVGDDGLQAHDHQKLLLIHGVQDRMTSAEASRRVVEALQERGLTASFVGLKAADHAMLRRAGTWDHLVGGYLAATLEPGRDLSAAPEIDQLGAHAGEESIVTVI
jgi:alpha-beta hydrolase superfamily lysophospholipase